MTSQIAALTNEQKRQSDEMSELRKMHTDLIRSVAELCGRLDVINTQYEHSSKAQETIRGDVRSLSAKVDGLLLDQATNKMPMEFIRNIQRYAITASVSAVGAGGTAIYTLVKQGIGS